MPEGKDDLVRLVNEWTEASLAKLLGGSNDDVEEDLVTGSVGVDRALLTVSSDTNVSLYQISDDCYKCPLKLMDVIRENESKRYGVGTKYMTEWRLYQASGDPKPEPYLEPSDRSALLCTVHPENYGQHGHYSASYIAGQCTVRTLRPPDNIYKPLAVLAAVAVLLWAIYALIRCLLRRCHKRNPESTSVTARRRIASLDTFRGINIALMIFVNNGGGGYWFMEHATWNGLHMADLVFPWFVWIMGVCIPLSVSSQMGKGVSRWAILRHIVKRSVMLFLLGLSLNTLGVGAELSSLRIMGVLQRLALCYMCMASVMVISTSLPSEGGSTKERGVFSDVVECWPRWIMVSLLLIVHSYFTFYFHPPGCPRGYLGPGGISLWNHDSNGTSSFNCTGGSAGYIDKILLGSKHLYQNPTVRSLYITPPFDPESILGCLTSAVQVMLGVQAGITLMHHKKREYDVIKRWILWAILTGLISLILCQGIISRTDQVWVPVNKNLWSLSFVMMTTSTAFFLLALLYYLVDVAHIYTGSPFLYAGMNSTLLYVGHEVAYNLFPWHWKFGQFRTHLILTLENLWGTALWVIISYLLYKNKIFLSL